MNGSLKITVLCLIVAGTIAYSLYEKKLLDNYFKEASAPVLKMIPESSLVDFESKEPVDLRAVASNSNGLVVHFWGTWCAPCEYELPEFLKYAEKLKDYNVKVVLLAVKDDDVKIRKFLKKFKDLSENIILIHDKPGLVMKQFGVVKVPETFLFNPSGSNVQKFIGPQDWKMESYITRTKMYLSL